MAGLLGRGASTPDLDRGARLAAVAGPSTYRVVIADDEYLVREGARSVLSAVPGIEVVGLAGDPQELMLVIEETTPDVIVLDIKMPPTHRAEGIEAAHHVREKYPHIGVVILSQYADPEYALELLRHGSNSLAYLLKERLGRPAQLAEAIREVANGGSILDPKVVDALMEAQRRRSRSRLHGLTEREAQVRVLKDLFSVLDVSVTRAALGAELDVETLDGTERVKVDAGTQSGEVLRVKGKGVPNLGRRGRGDLFLTVQVETPKKLGRDERKLLEQWEELRGEEASGPGSLRHPGTLPPPAGMR